MADSKNDNLVSTAKKALLILQSFTTGEPEKKVTDLAESLGMSKSNISRLLNTLASEGFVIKDPDTKKYRLGLAIIPLYETLTQGIEVRKEAKPLLQKLVDEIGETANITIFQGQSILDILRVNCTQPVQIVSHMDVTNPIHCTSAGKVFLAHQEKQELTRYIEKGLIHFPAKSYSNIDEFLSMLEKIKEQEYAISIEELFEGMATIAAPIRDYTGQVVYSLSVLGPVHRFNPHNTSVIHKVKKYALDISTCIGYQGN
ncbi:transcriptional regulator [Halalkalibacter wakoensis JCM 9140]|uniref:Glycerol operon regulatory protein n=1 Tax=Halalkalibacter wakoensis JCM 9140 TaxID=1236970 RepID=W4Q7T2_9BACI|nr:IclR family transcriptional regulator [Halalkalibacter wakoensis]GAE28052.1 transcriptional regulator [Halalkalibacter wakoensis JCM 9140]